MIGQKKYATREFDAGHLNRTLITVAAYHVVNRVREIAKTLDEICHRQIALRTAQFFSGDVDIKVERGAIGEAA